MKVALEYHQDRWLVRLQGDLDLSCAAKLKTLLLQWLTEGGAGGKNLELDLERVNEIDVAILQLVWAAARDGARAGVRILSRGSDAVSAVIAHTGFDQAPGFPLHPTLALFDQRTKS